jgi:hypothetical protein
MGLVAAVMLAGGCQRHHRATFVNNTARDVTATLSGPGEIMPQPAALPVARDGGQAQFDVKVRQRDLPASYTWTADGRRGTLGINENSREDHVIDLSVQQSGIDDELRRAVSQPPQPRDQR